MQARPVIGGVFIKLLTDAQTWKKWAGSARTNGMESELVSYP